LAAEAQLELGQRRELDDLIRRLRLHLGRGGIFILEVDDDATLSVVRERIQAGLGGVQWQELGSSDDPIAEALRLLNSGAMAEAVFTVDLRALNERRARSARS